MSKTTKTKSGLPSRKLLDHLLELGQLLEFDFPEGFGTPTCRKAVVRSPYSPLALRFDFREDTKRLDVLAWMRSTSWEYDGERTDIHDAVSLAYAIEVWLGLGLTTSFVYEEGFVGIRSEMYSMTMFFTQPSPPGLTVDDAGIRAACGLLFLACQSWHALSSCSHPEHQKGNQQQGDTGYDWKAAEPWGKSILKALGPRADPNDHSYAQRLCPDWKYFYEHRSKVAVLRASQIASGYRSLLHKRAPEKVEGTQGWLLLGDSTRNYVSYSSARLAARVLRGVGEPATPQQLPFIALDNRVVFFGQDHIVALFRDTGRAAFEIERERVRNRYETESQLLFPPTLFTWSEKIADDTFESLICELLSLEPNVIRVRRSGVTRERDGGRDLIADWVVSPTSPEQAREPESRAPVPVVVQCKASTSTIGKSKVQDLRDTVESHGAKGYFLAVTSQISGQLITHLENLHNRLGWHIDWWTRIEIEQRLRKHPDVARRYSKVVQPR